MYLHVHVRQNPICAVIIQQWKYLLYTNVYGINWMNLNIFTCILFTFTACIQQSTHLLFYQLLMVSLLYKGFHIVILQQTIYKSTHQKQLRFTTEI